MGYRSLIRAAVIALMTLSLLSITPAVTEAGAAGYVKWGGTAAHQHQLKRGCHKYSYRYRVKAPTKQWLIEIQLINPKGVNIASSAALAESDPPKARRYWRLCRASTGYGRYTMKMKVTYQDAMGRSHSGFVKPSHFKMIKPKKKRR